MWEVRKQKLHGDDSCPNQLQSKSSPGCLGCTAGVEGQRDGRFQEGKWYCVCYRVNVGERNIRVGACTCRCTYTYNVHSCMDACACMCSSAHRCRCVADGGNAMAAS